MNRLAKYLIVAVVFIVGLDIAVLWYLNHGEEPSALFNNMISVHSDESCGAMSVSDGFAPGGESGLRGALLPRGAGLIK